MEEVQGRVWVAERKHLKALEATLPRAAMEPRFHTQWSSAHSNPQAGQTLSNQIKRLQTGLSFDQSPERPMSPPRFSSSVLSSVPTHRSGQSGPNAVSAVLALGEPGVVIMDHT